METLVASLNTVLYMLLVMVLGRWVVGRLPERDTVVAQLNRLVFSMFLPFMVFQNIYTTDIKKLLGWYNLLVEKGLTDFVEEKAEEDLSAEKAE